MTEPVETEVETTEGAEAETEATEDVVTEE